MTKKKVEAKVKAVGTLTVENDARGRRYDRREAEKETLGHTKESFVEEVVEEAKEELIEIVEDEVQIYKKAMKGKHIAELFSEE